MIEQDPILPYEAHQHCEIPSDDTIVWRYMTFPTFMSLLEMSSIWLSRADLLDDRREACLTESERNQIREQQGDKGERFIRSLEEQRHATFVNCWYESAAESMAMWDLYGKKPAGIAVKSTIGRLKQSLVSEKRTISIGRVRYLDWKTCASWPNNVLGMAVRKAEGYKHESEVRLATWAYDAWQWDFGREGPPRVFHHKEIEDCLVAVLKEQSIFADTLEKDMRRAVPVAINRWMFDLQLAQVRRGIPASVDVNCLVQGVVLGPREPEWSVELLQKIMGRYGLTAPLSASELRYVDGNPPA